MDRPTVISLYSGAGGMDLGFAQFGFELLWANDFDQFAVQTYTENIGDHAVCGDVLDVLVPQVHPDVLVGGPPCQGFSVIGRMRRDDPRSRHVFHYLEMVEHLAPRTFVMENVKALASSPRWAPLRDDLLHRARDLGYDARLVVLNAADYGVPQARERMFILGSRVGYAPSTPAPTTADAHPTVRDALELLPPFGEPGNDSTTRAKLSRAGSQ